MTMGTIVTVLLAIASWAISGLITVTYMKAQHTIQMKYMGQEIEAINKHLESTDERHEELSRDFNNHRVECARDKAVNSDILRNIQRKGI